MEMTPSRLLLRAGALIVLVVLGACVVRPRHDAAAEAAQMALQRARMEEESMVAVTQRGITVCRELTLGIAERDWIRGEVIATDGREITVRISDAGRFAHLLDNIAVTRGSLVRSAAPLWTPCR